MKKAIKKLEQVKSFLNGRYRFGIGEGVDNKPLKKKIGLLAEVIAELKAGPRWETPEQYEKRTGEEWPLDWPIWYITKDEILGITTIGEEEVRKPWGNNIYVIATEAGPPPFGWRPEEGKI
jgi:hypothetical protein